MHNPSMCLEMFRTLLGGIHAPWPDYKRICLWEGYSIAPRTPPGSAHGDKTVASCFVVCVHRLCVSVSAALSSVSLYLKSIFLYRKYCSRQPVLLDVI